MGSVKESTRNLGEQYESLAVQYLKDKNYIILDRNWRFSNWGEIDIVAVDPNRYGREYLVFIEVKFRYSSLEFSTRAVDYKKQMQLKKLAELYLKSNQVYGSNLAISFDVVAITKKGATPIIKHINNAFS